MGQVTELYRKRVAADRLDPDPAQQVVLPSLDKMLADLGAAPAAPSGLWHSLFGGGKTPAPAGSSGVYLWGDVGRGKSMLLDLTMQAADIPQKRRVHFHEFMQEIQAGLDAARKRGDSDTMRPVALAVAEQARLLCFDEMQITDIADAMIVGRLFQLLFEQGVVVVTTSNRVPEDLYKDGLNRQIFLPFIDLLRDRMTVVELSSAIDYRQGRAASDKLWFAPTDAEAQAQMDAVWVDLTQGATEAPLEIPLKGRNLDLPRHAGGVGRIGFQDLCGKPLGPVDYLALALAVKVLMIDDIPRLGRDNFDEAKRFVTLIDTLYEAKVRLIASAAAEPEGLYEEGRGSFEFRRTASRLREMQAADWGRANP